MTIETQVSKVRYTGTGLVATYPYAFPILEDADLVVIEVDTEGGETTLVLDTDYTVTGAGVASGGNVVLSENLTSGHALVIYRDLDLVQETDLANQQAYFLETVEDAFDYQTMISQQLQEQVDRSLKLSVTDARDPEAIVDDLFDARDEVQAAATAAEDSAIRAEVAATTVSYYNHEGTLAEGESVITLPWAYDVNVGVEVYLAGVKQTESSLVFTDAYTVTLDAAVSASTPFEVVASAGAKGDLVNLLAASGGSELVGFLQDGTGAVARTAQDKMREWVSVKDFGAVGDGVTDDTAAIQKAIDTGAKHIILADGPHLTSATLDLGTSGSRSFIGHGFGVSSLLTTINDGSPVISFSGEKFNVSGFTIGSSTGSKKNFIGVKAGDEAGGTSCTRSKIDVFVSNAAVGAYIRGWINDIDVFAKYCTLGFSGKENNSCTMRIRTEECTQGFSIATCYGTTFTQILDENTFSAGTTTVTNEIDDFSGITVDSLYIEAGNYSTTVLKFAGTTQSSGLTVKSIHCVASPEDRTDAVIVDKVNGVSVAGTAVAGGYYGCIGFTANASGIDAALLCPPGTSATNNSTNRLHDNSGHVRKAQNWFGDTYLDHYVNTFDTIIKGSATISKETINVRTGVSGVRV